MVQAPSNFYNFAKTPKTFSAELNITQMTKNYKSVHIVNKTHRHLCICDVGGVFANFGIHIKNDVNTNTCTRLTSV